MSDSAIEVSLPSSFFDLLDSIKETVQDGFKENNSDTDKIYDNNINSGPDRKKITPNFDLADTDSYSKFGAAFMLGAADVFFNKWEVIKREEDYIKVKDKVKKDLAPTVNVNFPEEKQEEKPPTTLEELLGLLLSAGALYAANWIMDHGSDLIGQVGEIVVTSLGKLNIFNKDTWAKRADKLSAIFGKLTKPFDWLSDFFAGKGKIGGAISTGLKKISTSLGNITKSLAKGAATFLGKIGSKLKFLPFIGTVIGFYQAYLRFEKGEYIKGMMELAAALPFVGLPISIGLNALVSLWDADIGGGAIAGAITKKVGTKLLSSSFFIKIAGKLLKPLAYILKRIPFLGSIISLGFAIYDFTNGEYLKGTLGLVSALVQLLDFVVPGLGTILSIGVDALSYFLTESDTGKGIVEYVKNTSFSQMLTDARNYVGSGLAKVLRYLPFIGTIFHVADAIDLFEQGEYFKGAKHLLYGILQFTGTGGLIVAGLEFIEYLFTGSDSTSDLNPPEKSGPSWFDEIYNWFGDVFSAIGDWFSGIFDSVYNFVANQWNLIKERFELAKNIIAIQWNSFGQWIGSIFNKVYNWFAGIFDGFFSFINDIWTGIGNAFNSIVNVFKSIWEGVTSAFDWLLDLPGKIWDWFYGTIVKPIKDFFGSTVGAVVKFYNKYFASEENQIDLDMLSDEAPEGLIGAKKLKQEATTTAHVNDNRVMSTNNDLVIELNDTKGQMINNDKSYKDAFNKNKLDTSKLGNTQEKYLAQVANGINTLNKNMEEKPRVVNNTVNNNTVNRNNSSINNNISSGDPRRNYVPA